jgi:hypothetical protein
MKRREGRYIDQPLKVPTRGCLAVSRPSHPFRGSARVDCSAVNFDGIRLGFLVAAGQIRINHAVCDPVTYQMAEVAVPRQMFREILRLIAELRP